MTEGAYGIDKTTPEDLDSVTVYTKQLRDLVENTRSALKNGTNVSEADKETCQQRLLGAERVLKANAQVEKSSAKLNVVKADELASVLASLREAAKRCR